jgi:hypothetical protein
MAKSLFALENDDIADQVEELNVTPEEGEVAAVQAESETEGGDVQEITEAVDSGVQAADELEEVQDVVEQAGDEGLSPIAAEAVRLAISAIASKIGANPKAVYSLYAVENFQSVSGRRANTQIALEGVQEFLKDLWKKIKAALTKLWTKMKDFWTKHVSASGRMIKAVESMKAKVKASSGKISGKAYLDKAPSSVAAYFKTAKDVNATVVRESLFDVGLFEKAGQSNADFARQIEGIAKSGDTDSTKSNDAIHKLLESQTGDGFSIPVVGGEVVKFDIERDSEEGTVVMNVTREPAAHLEENPGMAVADKSTLLGLLNDAQILVKAVAKVQKNSEKSTQKFNEAMSAVEKLIEKQSVSKGMADNIANKTGISATDPEIVRKLMRLVYKGATFDAKAQSVLIAESIKSCKATLTYAAACLKQYK